MRITVSEFAKSASRLPVVVHSIDMLGYQAAVIIDQKECYLVGPDNRPLRYKSLMEMREKLSTLPTESVVLNHRSAYDEIINLPVRECENTLKVSLSNELYPAPDAPTSS